MAPELSSNWKKLQAKIKAESTTTSGVKRKASEEESGKKGSRDLQNKRQRVEKDLPQKKKKKRLSDNSTPAPLSSSAHSSRMGAAQSSKIDDVSKLGVAPSLALWAEDNDISPEDLAEAYGLGLNQHQHQHQSLSAAAAAPTRPNEGLAPGIEVGKYVAIDCEMVGVGDGGHEDSLARVSVVDFHGRQIYDSFVRQREPVTNWRTHVSGVSQKDMRTARGFDEVQAQVAELLRGRILVGHDVKHDLHVLMLDHHPRSIRDTARFSGFKKYGHGPKPALRVLADKILGIEIQTGAHSSVEDARVAMLLFRRYKNAMDMECLNRFPDPAAQKQQAQSGSKNQKKTKKKRRN